MNRLSISQIPPWLWIAFAGTVAALLVLDLFGHRGRHSRSRKASILWSLGWIGAGLGFGGVVWAVFGPTPGEEYLAAWAIEKSLSLDNLFVFLLIFRSFSIEQKHQHRVLFWGIFGAIVFRGIFIFLGAAALQRWEWISFVFGALLLVAAWRALREDPAQRTESRLVNWLSAHFRFTRDVGEGHFIRKEDHRRVATPLLVALVAIELSDVMFAVDSIPAAFSVTRSTFIVYSSNVFAILGLRALYIVLSKTIAELEYLHYGLAGVLAFAAVKMIIEPWFDIPPLVSVGIIVVIIGAAVWISLHRRGAGSG